MYAQRGVVIRMGQYNKKLQEIFKNMLNKSGKDKILIIILTGVLLLIISLPTKKTTETKQVNTESTENTDSGYEEYMEEKLENILSQVDGVGKVEVIISFKNTGEKVIAKDEKYSSENIQETDSSGGVRTTNQGSSEITNIYHDTEQGSEPFVKNENMPEVEGVIIVAQGGGDGTIATNITSAVESLLGVPVHKVKVLKMS